MSKSLIFDKFNILFYLHQQKHPKDSASVAWIIHCLLQPQNCWLLTCAKKSYCEATYTVEISNPLKIRTKSVWNRYKVFVANITNFPDNFPIPIIEACFLQIKPFVNNAASKNVPIPSMSWLGPDFKISSDSLSLCFIYSKRGTRKP